MAGRPDSWAAVALGASLALGAAPLRVHAAYEASLYIKEISPPSVITIEFETDLLAYDLCWSDKQDSVRTYVAAQVANQMSDPSSHYVLDFPQLPREYEAMRLGATDLLGRTIPTSVVRDGMYTYEDDLSKALADVVTRVRQNRPGAMLAVEGFEPMLDGSTTVKKTNDLDYWSLTRVLDFATVDAAPDEAELARVTSKDRRTQVNGRGGQNKTTEWSSDPGVLAIQLGLVAAYTADVSTDSWLLGDDEDLSTQLLGLDDPETLVAWSAEASAGDLVLTGGEFSNSGGTDSGTTDSGTTDSGTTDSGTTDSGTTDSGTTDSGTTDSGTTDSGTTDSGTTDSGTTDSGTTDSGTTDSGTTDSGTTDSGTTDSGSTDGTVNGTNGGTDTTTTDGGTTVAPNPVVLVPGSGFPDTFLTPAVQGDPLAPGADATAIARWDVVPYQTITGSFDIGVVAFHINGIQRVDFSLNGGPWAPVYDMTLNQRTGVYEFTARVEPSLLEDGLFEVRAIAYPFEGIPRVLAGPLTSDARKVGEHSMLMTSNFNGSLPNAKVYASPTGSDETGNGTESNPFQTIMRAAKEVEVRQGGLADGGEILLMPGDYSLGPAVSAWLAKTQDRWLTIKPADENAPMGSVRITEAGSGGLKTNRVHLQNIQVVSVPLLTASGLSLGMTPTLWLDGCDLTGNDPLHDIHFANTSTWHGGVYVTDSAMRNVLRASGANDLVRGVTFDNIAGDVLESPRLVIDSTASNVEKLHRTIHNDVLQFGGQSYDNIIIYNFTATENLHSQVLFARAAAGGPTDDTFNNSAFVNVLLAPDPNTGNFGQWQFAGNHLLFWHFSHLGQPFSFRDDSDFDNNGYVSVLKNVSIRNSVFHSMAYTATGQPVTDLQIMDNHFIYNATFGSSATSGDALLVSPSNQDFRPLIDSPLNRRISIPLIEGDIRGIPVLSEGAIGPLQPN